MAQIIKKGKLYVDIFYKPQIMRSFELHRDLKSCLTLAEAEQILSQKEQEYITHGKTALLQFLNGYPLSYNYKRIHGALKIHIIIAKMKQTKGYEQQLKYGIFSKLRQYLMDEPQKNMIAHMEQEEKVILEQIKTEPYDLVHAINFLFLQKEGMNSDIFYHCMDVLKQTDYQLLLSCLPKITPLLLRRLHLFDWAYFRRFKHLLDFIVYDYHPLKEGPLRLALTNLIPIVQLQLHRLGYQKIPKCIDELIGEVCQQLEGQNRIDMLIIQTTFTAFKYLPINYNEKAFKLLHAKLLQRLEKSSEVFHVDKLPYLRLKAEEIKEIYSKAFKNNSLLASLLYIGNQVQVRKWLKKTGLVNQLLKEYRNNKDLRQKQYSSNIMACHILIEEFESNKEVMAEISAKYQTIMRYIEQNNLGMKVFKSLTLCHIFQIQQISQKLMLPPSKRDYDFFFEQFAKRESDFSQIYFIDNVAQALTMFHNTSNPVIIGWINVIVSKILMGTLRFNFKFFSQYIFLLERSNSTDEFGTAKEILYNRLKPQDAPYLVQLYVRFGNKSIKGNTNIMVKIWEKQRSFKSIGKFLTINSFGLFSSSKGQLLLPIKNILEAIQPSLCLEDIQEFMIDEIVSILRFLYHFRNFLPSFLLKFSNLALNLVQKRPFQRQQPKLLLAFLEQCVLTNKQSVSHAQNCQRIMKIFSDIKKNFKESTFIKAKQMQFNWILGVSKGSDRISLAVEQLLQEISNPNNSSKKLDTALLLLKLYSFQVITLSNKMSQQLVKLSLSAIDQDEKQIKQVINITHMLTKKSNGFINPEKAEGLLRITRYALQRLKTRHSFEYYIHLIDLAKQCRDTQLLKKCVLHLSSFDIKMQPSQLKKVANIIKFYPFVEVNSFRQKLIKETYNYSDYLQDQLPEILYIVHSLRDSVPQHQLEMYNNLLATSQRVLLHKIKSTAKLGNQKEGEVLLLVLKSLWVSVKVNKFNAAALQLYQFVRERKSELLEIKDLEGLSWDYVYYIHNVFEVKLKELDVTQPHKKVQPERKSLFKVKKNTEESTQLFKNVEIFKKYFKNHQFTLSNQLKQSLQKLGLENLASNPTKHGFNFYACNYKLKGITLPIYVKKQSKQYGLIVLEQDRNFYNESHEKRGKVDFMVNALSIITKLPIIAVAPEDKIQI